MIRESSWELLEWIIIVLVEGMRKAEADGLSRGRATFQQKSMRDRILPDGNNAVGKIKENIEEIIQPKKGE